MFSRFLYFMSSLIMLKSITLVSLVSPRSVVVPPPPAPPPPREVAAAAAAAAAVLVLRALEICDIESSVGNWRLAAEVMAGLVVVVTPPTVTPVAEVVVKPFNPAGKWNSFSLLLNSSARYVENIHCSAVANSHGKGSKRQSHIATN